MKVEQFQGKGLHYLTLAPDDYNPEVSYPLVIMLHGFGANMRDLAGLAPAISSTGYVYACPNAPIPFDLGFGQVGYGWMPPRGQATPGEIQQSETVVGEFFEEIFDKLKTTVRQAILLGFSQGCGMTYRFGLNRPDAFAGLVALSASLPDPEVLQGRLPADRRQQIFVAHGKNDPMVSVEGAQKTRKFLNAAGYSAEYHEYFMGHEISTDTLNDLIPWMHRVLPPLT